LLIFSIISLAMGAIQWMAFSRGGAAQDWAYRLSATGHPRAGRILASINDSATLRFIDRIWQSWINAPRNHLFARLGLIHSPDSIYFYGASERIGWWPDVRDGLLFAAGTVLVYWPLLLIAAVLRARTE